MTRALTLALAILAAPLTVIAAPWTLDKSHAHITFSVDHLGFSTTQGAFRDFDAEINFDPENIEATKVKFVIQTASVDTFFGKRDDHIRNADFLNVEKFPTMTFESKKVMQTGDTTATVEGEVTLLGVTKPVTFAAELVKMGPHPFNPEKMVAGFKVTGELDRTQFGMDKFAPAIGAVLPVEINFEMSPAG
jgi:polyisoprenoid-binding protein YceI